MVFKDCTFFSYAFLATAVILLTAHGSGLLCDTSPNEQVCDSIVGTRTEPRDATYAACHKLIDQIKVAKVVARRQPRSKELDVCISLFNYATAIDKLALEVLASKDYTDTWRYLNSTRKYFEACDNLFKNHGKTNPIAKSTKLLNDMAFVGAYLASLIL